MAAAIGLYDPRPLAVSWLAADLSLFDSWDRLLSLTSDDAGRRPLPSPIWARNRDRLAGGDGDLAKTLARVPTGRLVVLGEPGAGKTTLMIRLVLKLLAQRTAGDPVPMLISLTSWDPVKEGLYKWLKRKLKSEDACRCAARREADPADPRWTGRDPGRRPGWHSPRSTTSFPPENAT